MISALRFKGVSSFVTLKTRPPSFLGRVSFARYIDVMISKSSHIQTQQCDGEKI